MKKLSLVLFICGIGMIILSFLFPNNNLKWKNEYGKDFSFKNLKIYNDTNMFEKNITIDNNSYSYNIIEDMDLQKINNSYMQYSNNDLTIKYNFEKVTSTIEEYKQYLINSFIDYNNINLLRLDSSDNISFFWLKVGYSEYYFEELHVLINNNNDYYLLKYSTVNNSFGKNFLNKIVNGIKKDNKDSNKCFNNECELSILKNKNSLKTIKFSNLSNYTEIKNNNNNILSLKHKEKDEEVLISLFYDKTDDIYSDTLDLYNDLKNTEVKINNYNAVKIEDEKENIYLFKIDDNTVLLIEITSNINVENIINDFANFKIID